MVRFSSIHLILAIAAKTNLELWTLTRCEPAFLNGELNGKIYMEQRIGL